MPARSEVSFITCDSGSSLETHDVPSEGQAAFDRDVRDDVFDLTKAYWYYPGDTTQAYVRAYGATYGAAYDYAAHGLKRANACGAGANNDKFLYLDASVLHCRGALPRRADWASGEVFDRVRLSSNTVAYAHVYSDALVKFSAAAAAPALQNGDKIVVWLHEDGCLRVTAGAFASDYRTASVCDYRLATACPADTWCRVTVKAIDDITANAGVVGFEVYLDGQPAVVADGAYDPLGDAVDASWLTARARYLIAERRLFPSLVQGSTDEARTLSALAFSGTGAADDVSFATTSPEREDGTPYAGDARLFTVRWDAGVTSFSYELTLGAAKTSGAVAAAESAAGVRDILIGGTGEAALRVYDVVYDAEHAFRAGRWYAAEDTGCIYGGADTFTSYVSAENPTAVIASTRDSVAIGEGEGAFTTFKAAMAYAAEQGIYTLVLSNDLQLANGDGEKDDKGFVDVCLDADGRPYDFALDLNGHSLSNGNAAHATIELREGGRLRIYDSAGGGRVVPGGSGKSVFVSNAKKNADCALVLEAGTYDGQVSVNAGTCEIEPDLAHGLAFHSTDDKSFYLAGAVTDPDVYYYFDSNYWRFGTGFTITYSYPTNYVTMPVSYVTRYTAETAARALPEPTMDDHAFLGWYDADGTRYADVSELTPDPRDITLTARWRTEPEGGSVWTGKGAPDNRWLNPDNWSYEGVPAEKGLAIFPDHDGLAWPVQITEHAFTNVTVVLTGDVALHGKCDFAGVVFSNATGRVVGDATLVYAGRAPKNLKARFGSVATGCSTNWTGTVMLSGITEPATLDDLADWGTDLSRVVFNGVCGDVTAAPAEACAWRLMLIDDGERPAWISTTGFTGNTVDIPVLEGTGALVLTNGFRRPSRQVFRFRDITDYEGRMDVTDRRVVIGEDVPSDEACGTITFADGAYVRAGLGWVCSNAVFHASLVTDGDVGATLLNYLDATGPDVSVCTDVMRSGSFAALKKNASGKKVTVVAASAALAAAPAAETAAAATDEPSGAVARPAQAAAGVRLMDAAGVSATITVTADTTTSAINAEAGEGCTDLTLNVTDGVTITWDFDLVTTNLTVSGDFTFLFNALSNTLATAAIPAAEWSGWFGDPAKWRGTVRFATVARENLDPAAFGNVASTLFFDTVGACLADGALFDGTLAGTGGALLSNKFTFAATARVDARPGFVETQTAPRFRETLDVILDRAPAEDGTHFLTCHDTSENTMTQVALEGDSVSAAAKIETNAMDNASWGYVISGLGVTGGDIVQVFTNTTEEMSWQVPVGVTSIRYLVVGGGGSGGNTGSNRYGAGGGGGAGGALTDTYSIVNKGESFTITVGRGGVTSGGDQSQTSPGVKGGSSVLQYGSELTLTAEGGGGGRSAKSVSSDCNGACGGGAAAATTTHKTAATGGSGSLGYDGGDAATSSVENTGYAAGGGGMGSAGADADANQTKAGNGGDGITSSITGAEVYYCAGGGGGSRKATAGSGGLGGGGDGGQGAKGSAALGYGCGGGGSGANGTSATDCGGAGYQGVVMIRYTVPGSASEGGVVATVPTVYENDTQLPRPYEVYKTSEGYGVRPAGGSEGLELASDDLPGGASVSWRNAPWKRIDTHETAAWTNGLNATARLNVASGATVAVYFDMTVVARSLTLAGGGHLKLVFTKTPLFVDLITEDGTTYEIIYPANTDFDRTMDWTVPSDPCTRVTLQGEDTEWSGAIAVPEGACLATTGTVTLAGNCDLAGTLLVSGGTLTLAVPEGCTRTLTGTVTGAGALAKAGAGTLLCAGTCSSTGGFTVEAGLARQDVAGAAGATVTVAGGGTFDLNSLGGVTSATVERGGTLYNGNALGAAAVVTLESLVNRGTVAGPKGVCVSKSLSGSGTFTDLDLVSYSEIVLEDASPFVVTGTFSAERPVRVRAEAIVGITAVTTIATAENFAANATTFESLTDAIDVFVLGNALLAKPSTVSYADLSFATGEVEAGLNFSRAKVTVNVDSAFLGTGTYATYRVFARDLAGNVVETKEFTLATSEPQSLEFTFTDLAYGDDYTFGIEGANETSFCTADATCTVALGNRTRWIDEDALTFAAGGETGVWTNGLDVTAEAKVDGYVHLAYADTAAGEGLKFTPDARPPERARVREIRLVAAYDAPNYLFYLNEKLPSRFAGVALSYEDAEEPDKFALAVVRDGGWTTVPRSVLVPVTNATYDITVCFDLDTHGITYYLMGEDGMRSVLASGTYPADVDAEDCLARFNGAGRIRALTGDWVDGTLADVNLVLDENPAETTTNFQSLVVSGVATFTNLCANTDRKEYVLEVTVRDALGHVLGTASQTVGEDGRFRLAFEDLAQGGKYAYEAKAYVKNWDDPNTQRHEGGDIYEARAASDGWIRENAKSFDGKVTKTGTWSDTDRGAAVSGDVIRFDVPSETTVGFTPTAKPDPEFSSLREYRFDVAFATAARPDEEMPTATLAGVTLVADAVGSETCHFAFCAEGVWTDLPRETFAPETGVTYSILLTVDHANGVQTYSLVDGGATNFLYAAAFAKQAGDGENPTIRFTGSGTLAEMDGDYWDAALARVGTKEYWDLADAMANSTAEDPAVPLTRTAYAVTGAYGEFWVREDADGLLSVLWPSGYPHSRTVASGVVHYEYSGSDLWIDFWSDKAADVDTSEAGVFKVLTEKGFAYIAKLARDGKTFAGEKVTLANDLNGLAQHVWMPIVGFRGTFDGGSRAIVGLRSASAYTNLNDVAFYGLFGTVTNAAIANLRLQDVAVTNFAEAVGALIGQAGGDLSVSGVAADGSVRGARVAGGVIGRIDGAGTVRVERVSNAADVCVAGGAPAADGSGARVAGVVGYAADYDALTLDGNTNDGAVSNAAEDADRDYYAAGVALVGAGAAADGRFALTVKGCTNGNNIRTAVSRLPAAGGNVARVVANGSRNDRFASVTASANSSLGGVDCPVAYNDDPTYDAPAQEDFPLVNLAPAFVSYDDETGDYRTPLEADGNAVALDPVWGTVRTSQARFENGFTNVAGAVNDRITASEAGATVTVDEDLASWWTIELDRNLTLDLSGHLNDAAFADAFRVGPGVEATLKNADVTAPEGVAFDVAEGARLNLKNVRVWSASAAAAASGEGQILFVSGGANVQPSLWSTVTGTESESGGWWTVSPMMMFALDGQAMAADKAVRAATSASELSIGGDTEASVNVQTREVVSCGDTLATFADYYDLRADYDGASTTVRLSLNTNAIPVLGAPAVTTDATPTVAGAGPRLAAAATLPQITVPAVGTRTGLWYGLQYKASLGDAWQEPASWHAGADGETIELRAPSFAGQGFYRVEATDIRP